jgi:hypothetical protein
MQPKTPINVKFFCGILYAKSGVLEACLDELKTFFGEVDYTSREISFDVTDYYEQEMGKGIKRLFVSFDKLIDPSELCAIKVKTNEVEERFAEQGKRPINLDPGYMDYDKVVLASAKQGPFKIYLDRGIWADMTLHYEKGRYYPTAWAFADFSDGRYNTFFLHMRERYKAALRSQRQK